jgi:murein DD-endopeptidase MepM/ murein hydrolase activator NlpD
MPNFRDPKLAILSLLVVFLSALIWTNPPPAGASESQRIAPLKLAQETPAIKSPLWLPPLNASLEVLHPFLRPSSDWGAGHRGVDIVADADSMVLSPHRSTIGFANLAFGVPTVVLDHEDGSSQVFQPVCLVESVGLGQKLDAGDAFGAFCSNDSNDGHCGQLGCIHWSYRLDKDTYINPLRMIGVLQPAKLLPLDVVETASAV